MKESSGHALEALRDFRSDDQASTRAGVVEGTQERWGGAFEPAANPDPDDIWAYYVVERRAEVVVCKQDGEIATTATLLPPTDRGLGQLVRIAVIRQQQRKGIAAAIVKELVRRARQNEMKTLRVMTDAPWIDAVDLDRACGSRPSKRQVQVWLSS